MTKVHRRAEGAALRSAVFAASLALLAAAAAWGGSGASAQTHIVMVEGNCLDQDPLSPSVSSQSMTLAPGTCGDYDGDRRIGNAEDHDGDRVFGTIQAALGIANTSGGIAHNGRIVVVTSGRFNDNLYIGQNLVGPGTGGVADPGNVTIEAAPGVEATLDAYRIGEHPGVNNQRQGGTGIQVVYVSPTAGQPAPHVVTLRNLVIRNYSNGITVARDSRLHIDNCRLENNLNYGIRAIDSAHVVITDTRVDATGFRVGASAQTVANPGIGIAADDTSELRIADTTVSHSVSHGIANRTGAASKVVLFGVKSFLNGGVNIFGPWTPCPDVAFCGF